jgi:hypothetical protein
VESSSLGAARGFSKGLDRAASRVTVGDRRGALDFFATVWCFLVGLARVDGGGERFNDLFVFCSDHPREPGGGHFADESTAKRMRIRIDDCIQVWFRRLEKSDKLAPGSRRSLTFPVCLPSEDAVSCCGCS